MGKFKTTCVILICMALVGSMIDSDKDNKSNNEASYTSNVSKSKDTKISKKEKQIRQLINDGEYEDAYYKITYSYDDIEDKEVYYRLMCDALVMNGDYLKCMEVLNEIIDEGTSIDLDIVKTIKQEYRTKYSAQIDAQLLEKEVEREADELRHKGYRELIDTGLTHNQVKSVIETFTLCEIDSVDGADFIKEVEGSKIIEVHIDNVTYRVRIMGNNVLYITDEDGYAFYSDGKFDSSYLHLFEYSIYTLSTYAKDVVKQVLTSPSSAKFPSVLWSGDWSIITSEDYPNCIGVKSYVDSANLFGAMLRSNFEILVNKDGELVYFTLDGERIK